MVSTRVVRRSLGPEGNVVDSFNHNKMLDTRIYDIRFIDGMVQQLSANRIALSMYENVDSEGFTTKKLDQVKKHRKTDKAIEKSDGYVKDSKGRKSRKIPQRDMIS